MIRITTYKAFDGTCFESEERCIAYESEKLKTAAANNYRFLDSELTDLDCDTIYENLENAIYIVVKTTAAVDYIQHLANLDGMAAPEGIGFWKWDSWHNKYRKVNLMDIEELKKKVEFMEHFYNECQENKERI